MTRPSRVPGSAVAVLLLFTGITYFPVWGGKVPIPSDLLYYFVAYHDAAEIPSLEPVADVGDLVTSFYMFRTMAEQGASKLELPIWNPYILSGSPFLGHSQSALFYPPNFVYYLLPLPIAWTVALLLRMFLAGLAMVLLIRALGGTTAGAVLAGVAYSACGALTSWQGFSRGDTSIWLPFVCYAVVKLRQSPSARNVALIGIAFAVPLFAGHPETVVHITMVGVLLALTLWLWPSRPTDSDIRPVGWNWILLFAAGGVLAMGISSIQLLPTVEFLRQMPGRFSMTWGGFPTEQVLGLVSRDTLRSPNSGGVPIPEGAGYVGMITLLLAALAPFYERKRYAIFLITITLIAFGIAYSIPPMPWLVAHTPLKVMKSVRMLLVVSFGLAALAGLGLSAIERDRSLFEVKRRRNLALLSFGVVFIVTFLLVHTLKSNTPVRIEFMRRPSFSRALLFIAAVFIVLGLLGWLRGRRLALAACALATFDLATFSQGFTGYALPHEIFPRISLFDFLQKQGKPDEFRIAQLDGAYPVNAPMHYGLSSADGYDLLTEKFQNFAADLGANAVTLELTAAQTFKNRDRRLDLLNVKYLVVRNGDDAFKMISARPEGYSKVFDNDRVAVFENKRVLPRAFAVPASGIEVIEDFPQNLNRVKDPAFDPEKQVVLSSMPEFPGVLPRSFVTGGQSVIKTEESDVNGDRFRVNVPVPSVLVVSQISYPGWKARVDGTETAVYDADYALYGIPVPAGEHEVELRLEPVSLKLGTSITSISIVVVGVLALKRQHGARRRRRRSGSPPQP